MSNPNCSLGVVIRVWAWRAVMERRSRRTPGTFRMRLFIMTRIVPPTIPFPASLERTAQRSTERCRFGAGWNYIEGPASKRIRHEDAVGFTRPLSNALVFDAAERCIDMRVVG